MIITRTPFRISFIGGGSDLPAFYNQAVGRVVSAAVDKYMFIAIQEKFDGKFRIGYSITEVVNKPKDVKNTRARAALEHFKVKKGVEIVSLADIPSQGTGLGSSSSYTIGIITGLSQLLGHHYHKDRQALAELACHLEMNVLKEEIGKQDQYAAAYGGLNIMEFHKDKVVVEPIIISPTVKKEFQNHLLAFYTGIARSAADNSKLLTKNLQTDEQKFLIQKALADLTIPFSKNLIRGDFQSLGEMLHEGWLLKQKTSATISNATVNELYKIGRRSGVWGGKLLGAGGGGFLLFFAPPKNHEKIRKTFSKLKELPIGFDDHGAKVIFNRFEYQ